MKDNKDKSVVLKKGNVYLKNENQKKDGEKTHNHPDTGQHQKQRGPRGDKKDDDPLSIGESDGSAG